MTKRIIPNTITSLNLLCGSIAVFLATQNAFLWAFVFILAGAFFDFFDGLSARLLKTPSPIGIQLDSLADDITFGLAPAMMLFCWLRPILGWWAGLALIMAAFSALRLAKFNVDDRQTLDFLGLPTPSCAMVCGSLATFLYVAGGIPAGAEVWILDAIAIVLGLLLVSEIPMFGMKIKKGHKLLDTKRIAFLILAVAGVLAVVLLKQPWSLAVLAVFSIYVIENLVVALINSFRRGA